MPTRNPKVKFLLNDLKYMGTVAGKKVVYYVFQTDRDYLVFSYRDSTYRKGNFNVVIADTIERIHKVFKGQKRVTRRQVEEHPKMKRFIKKFDALQALYVMVAVGQASIDGRSPNDRTLYFNFKG